MRRLFGVPVVALALAGVMLATSAGVATAAKDVIWLDTNEPQGLDNGIFPEATGDMVLRDGKKYIVTIQGTWSAWVPISWKDLEKGVPEPWPMYPSDDPQLAQGPVGLDAAYVFAYPTDWDQSKDDPPLELWAVRFSVDKGDSWTGTPRPKKDRYSKHHRYRYVVTGAGHPFTVQLTDPWSWDNYGRLRVVVVPAD